MNGSTIIERIKAHPGIGADATVGVVSSFGKGAELDIKERTRDIIVTANTSDIDLDDEVVDPRGADIAYFKANKMIFADHLYDLEQVAGKARDITPHPSAKDHRAWRVRAHIAETPIGETVVTIVRELGQIGVSIGFVVQDAGPPSDDEKKSFKRADGAVPQSVVRAWKWFELSFTALPCNVACQSLAMSDAKSADMIDGIDRLVSKNLIDRKYAAALGAPINAERKFHAVTQPRGILGVGGIIAVRREVVAS